MSIDEVIESARGEKEASLLVANPMRPRAPDALTRATRASMLSAEKELHMGKW